MAHSGAPNQFGDTTYTKVFVGGLAWETQRDAMRKHFEQFGEILEAVIITDRVTGRSKGYGFVTFKDAESARQACQDPTPIIDGRRANCNLASLGQKHRHRQGPGFIHGAAPYGPFSPQGYGYGPYGFHPQFPPEGYGFPQGPYGTQQFPMYGSPGAVYGGYPGVGPPMQGFPPSSQEAHLGVPPAYAPRRSGQAEGAAHGQYGTEMQQGSGGARPLVQQHDPSRPYSSSVPSSSQRYPSDDSQQ